MMIHSGGCFAGSFLSERTPLQEMASMSENVSGPGNLSGDPVFLLPRSLHSCLLPAAADVTVAIGCPPILPWGHHARYTMSTCLALCFACPYQVATFSSHEFLSLTACQGNLGISLC